MKYVRLVFNHRILLLETVFNNEGHYKSKITIKKNYEKLNLLWRIHAISLWLFHIIIANKSHSNSRTFKLFHVGMDITNNKFHGYAIGRPEQNHGREKSKIKKRKIHFFYSK